MSARAKAIVASVLIIGGSLGLWFAVLATLDTEPTPADCGIKPPASVPGPPVVANR